jgi:hypothetical protein
MSLGFAGCAVFAPDIGIGRQQSIGPRSGATGSSTVTAVARLNETPYVRPLTLLLTNGQEHHAMTTTTQLVAFGLGIGLALSTGGIICGGIGLIPVTAAAEETQKEIIAAQIRMQGYSCDKPISAKSEPQLSKPNEAVWILKCENSVYRVRLIPDMAATVERIE